MGKCYVLGAGFSRSVAGLPTMRELPARFVDIQHQEADCGHSNRAHQGTALLEFLEWYKQQVLSARPLNSGEQYGTCDEIVNIEAVLSFVDLNLAYSPSIQIISAAGDVASFEADSPFCKRNDLLAIRSYIQTYLYLALNGPYPDPASPQLSKFVSRLSAGDVVITFNYDLVVERELQQQQRWDAREGYGPKFSSCGGLPPACPSADVKVLKLHGSLNWEDPGILGQAVRLDSGWDGRDISSGSVAERSAPVYQGGHAACWILPSWMKRFAVPELLSVWGQARRAIEASSEIIVIGYSFPEADAAAILMLADSLFSEKKVTIVDPNRERLCLKVKRIFRHGGELVAFKCVDSYLASH